ncbi:DNA-binding transcriptional regulator [Parvibaculum sp.]|uniref:helix-turn-helix domain-containing protein n=1 Tax=Parvibaculum sp. TaxID=2024848 RepID=UPI002733D726|nr:helix-turn-helix transcriptional regulator [Parvibaculum sp.]MDP3328751.1 helix-turn-helix transcriptional regulator [Parvibaculum sp.]
MSDAKKLRRFREHLGLKQDQAAEFLGVSVYTISSIEADRRPLSPPQDAYIDAILNDELSTHDTPYIMLGKAITALELGDRETAIKMCQCALIVLNR